MKKLHFVSRDSNWQEYRASILKKMAERYCLSVTVLTAGQLKSYIQGDERVRYVCHRSWLPLSWKPSFFPGALVSIIRDRPDVVLGLANVSQLTEMTALLLCRMLGIRFVWWTHAYDHVPLDNRVLRLLKKHWSLFLFRRANAVVTFSEAGRDYLLAHGLLASRVICAPNTLDTDSLAESARRVQMAYPRQVLAAELGFDANARVILFSGRLLACKRVEDAILAVAHVQAAIPQVRLVVIGNGPDRARLEQLARQHLSDRCVFLGSVFDDDRLARIFSLAEIFFMPGDVGLAIVHAFSFGLPLITERVSTHGPEIQYLRDGYNGYLADEADVASLAARLQELLTDPEKLKAMSQNALGTVSTEASITLMLRGMAVAFGIEVPRVGV